MQYSVHKKYGVVCLLTIMVDVGHCYSSQCGAHFVSVTLSACKSSALELVPIQNW